MTEVKKLTDEEIQKINDLQLKQNALVTELGQVNLAKLNLEERENKAREFYGELLVEEITLSKELTDKYGAGQINLETGEITITQQ
jgi:hypothetical protein